MTVQTDKGDFRAKRVVITAGAWTNKLLQPTGLTLPYKVELYFLIAPEFFYHVQVERTEVLYWNADPIAFHHTNFPTFMFVADGYYNVTMYGLPISEYPGLFKVSYSTPFQSK